MLIGLISDSHDNIADLKKAFGVLESRGVELVLHAGDVISSGMCYAYEGFDMDLKLVYGNNDGDRVGIKHDFEEFGAKHLGDFGEIEVDGMKIALLHGTDEAVVNALASSGLYQIVVRGHSHRYNVETNPKSGTMVINPGEIWGHFTGNLNAAVLDTSTLSVEKVDLGNKTSIVEILGWKDRVPGR